MEFDFHYGIDMEDINYSRAHGLTGNSRVVVSYMEVWEGRKGTTWVGGLILGYTCKAICCWEADTS